MRFELLTVDPFSPGTAWLDQMISAKLGQNYQLFTGEQISEKLPDRALLRLRASTGQATDLAMRDLPSLQRAMQLQLAGVKVLNPPLAHYITDDKLFTANVLHTAGLPTPQTWDAHKPHGNVIMSQTGWIVKPRWGELGHDVTLYSDLQTAMEHASIQAEPQILQHFLPQARCIRLVVSQTKCYAAYEKWMPDGGIVAAIALGGERRDVDPDDYGMRELAIQAAKVCMADLVGVDILISDGRPYILELNISPGGLTSLSQNVQEEIIEDLIG